MAKKPPQVVNVDDIKENSRLIGHQTVCSGACNAGSANRTYGPLSLHAAVIPPEQLIRDHTEFLIHSDAYRFAAEAVKAIGSFSGMARTDPK